MVRLVALASLSLLLAGCEDAPRQSDKAGDSISRKVADRYEYLVNHPRPPARLIEAIERAVSRDPCVGNLDKWQRLYRYGLNEQREVDENKIVIDFRQAGVHGFKAGPRIGYPLEGVNVDDRPYDLVSGSFDRRSGKLLIKFCGPNLPPS